MHGDQHRRLIELPRPLHDASLLPVADVRTHSHGELLEALVDPVVAQFGPDGVRLVVGVGRATQHGQAHGAVRSRRSRTCRR